MKSRLQRTIHSLSRSPRKMLVIDAIGALITAAVLLSVASVRPELFGMPKQVLVLLGGLAVIFFVYASTAAIFLRNRWPMFIRIIAVANLLYCALTLLLLNVFMREMSIFGFAYFIAEMLLLCVLVYIELQVAGEIEAAMKVSTD